MSLVPHNKIKVITAQSQNENILTYISVKC